MYMGLWGMILYKINRSSLSCFDAGRDPRLLVKASWLSRSFFPGTSSLFHHWCWKCAVFENSHQSSSLPSNGSREDQALESALPLDRETESSDPCQSENIQKIDELPHIQAPPRPSLLAHINIHLFNIWLSNFVSPIPALPNPGWYDLFTMNYHEGKDSVLFLTLSQNIKSCFVTQ